VSADMLFVLRTTENTKLRSAARINIASMSKSVVQVTVLIGTTEGSFSKRHKRRIL
jgi:hypothetical protein